MPNPTPGRTFSFAVEYPPGEGLWASAPDPHPGPQALPGLPFTRAQLSRIVDGAVASGRIPASRRAYWRREVRAGGARGGQAITTLLQLHPAPPDVAAAARSDDTVYAAMYPDHLPPVPPADPGDEALYRQMYPRAAAGPDRHGPVTGHGPVAAQHAHEHPDYGGGTHYHPHAHHGDASHQPGTSHPHQPDSGTAAAARQLRAAGPAAAMTLDEVYYALYGDG